MEELASDYGAVSATATTVPLRGERVKIPPTKEAYSKWVPDIRGDPHFSRPDFADLGIFLAFEYADLCRATDAEKRSFIPADLPEIMTVYEWHHRSYYVVPDGAGGDKIMGDAPSTYETFPLLAEVLVTRDPSRSCPTLPPNNHWENWPEAGGL